MLVGDLPLVAVLERERLESIAFLSTARSLSVSSLVLLSTIRSKCHESVMSLVMSTMTRLPPHTQMREGEAPQLQCFATTVALVESQRRSSTWKSAKT
jgi:hypothetical protein